MIRALAARELKTGFPDAEIEEVDNQVTLGQAMARGGYDLVITDYQLPWTDGVTILREAKSRWPECPVIMFTGSGSEEIAVEAMKAGLDDYVQKTTGRLARLTSSVRIALAQAQHRKAACDSEARYRAFIAHSSEGIYRFETSKPVPVTLPVEAQLEWIRQHAYLAECNEVYAREHGFDRAEQMTGLTLDRMVSTPILDRKLFQDFRDSGYRLVGAETETPDGQGRQRAYINNLTGEVENGCLVRVWGVRRDITQQKLAEQEVRQSEAKLRAIFAAMTDVILIINAEGRYLEIGPTNPALLYRPAAEMVGKTVHELFPVELADLFLRSFRQTLETRQMLDIEYSLPIDGREMWFTARISPLSADTVIMVAHDITRRRATEAALKEANARLEATLKAIPDVMFEIDRETRVYNIYASERAPLDIPPDLFLGRRMVEVLPEPAARTIQDALDQAAGEGLSRGAVYELDLPLGRRWFEVSIAAKEDHAAADPRFIVISRDITERRQHEREMELFAVMSTSPAESPDPRGDGDGDYRPGDEPAGGQQRGTGHARPGRRRDRGRVSPRGIWHLPAAPPA